MKEKVKTSKEVIVIGKMIILSLSDAEEHIMDRLRSVIENTGNCVEIMPKSILFFKELKIQLREREVYRKGKLIHLSNKEFLALQFLTEHPRWVCTKEEIYDAVCGEKIPVDVDNIIYCLIRSLRKNWKQIRGIRSIFRQSEA